MTPKPAQQVHLQPGAKRRAIRMKRLLEKVPFGRSTVYAKLNASPDNRYADSTFPKPFYAPKCRFPLWWEDEVDAWLVAAENTFRAVGHVALPKAEPKAKPVKPVPHGTAVAVEKPVGPGSGFAIWPMGGQNFSDI